MKTWQNKANEIILKASTEAYRKANIKKDGTKYKKHRHYSVPCWVERMIDAMDRNDEEVAKAIMMYGIR